MSIDFRNAATQNIGTTYTDVYTCPVTAKSSIIIGMTVSNIESTIKPITIEARIEDISETTFTRIVATDTPIGANSTITIAGGSQQKIVLEANDRIQVVSSDINSADVFISVLEIT